MKGLLKKLFFTLLCGSLCYALSSCDDENENHGSHVGFGEERLDIDRLGGYYRLNVHVEEGQAWTLSVPETNEWITVLTPTGKGDASVELYIEDNGTKESRTDNLVLVTENGTKVQIPVSQTNLLNGESMPENDDVEFYDVFNNKGIGKGYDIINRKVKQSVVQMTGLKKLINGEDAPYADLGLYTEAPIAASDVKIISYDSIDNKLDSINVSLKIGVSFGLFKLDISGAYISGEKVADANVTYRLGCRYPVYEASLGYADLLGYVAEEEDAKIKRQMLSIGFLNLRDKIDELAENPSANKAQLDAALVKLDATYGPVVVTGTTLGGEMTMKLDADSFDVADNMGIKGDASLSIQAAISITGEAHADYIRKGEMLLSHSNLELTMLGGQVAKGQEMAKYLTSTMAVKRAEVNQLATDWANSIVMDGANKKNNTAEVVEMTLTPIWSFFDDEVAVIVQDYIVKKYKDNPKAIVDFSNY